MFVGAHLAHLEELDRLLALEVEVYQQLLDIEATATASLDMQSLDDFLLVLQEKDRLIQQVSDLENQRQQVSDRLALLLLIPASELTLKYLSAQVDEPYASRFVSRREHLQRLVREVQRCSEDTARYLHGALGFLNEALVFFQRASGAHKTYQPSGHSAVPQRGRILSGRV